MAETSLNPAEGSTSKLPASSLRAFAPFTLDLLRCELLRDGRAVPLRPKAFDLLAFLTSRAGEVLTKDQLIAAVWPGLVVTDDSLTQCVHELRSALGETGSLLKTVPRRGYRFDAVVESGPQTAPHPTTVSTAVPVEPLQAAAKAQPRRRRLELLGAAGLLVAVLTLAVLAWNSASRKPAASAPQLSLVLLPLESLDDATSTGFADALTADLNAELGRLASVFVIATGTAATYKGKPADPREVSRALGVRYVVRGTVQRSGDEVRLALAMVDGESGAQHWAQSFAIERARLRSAVDDVAQQVARSLNVQMYRSGGTRAAVLGPEQIQADDLAMQGWGVYFRGLSRENFLAALPLFEQAVAKDPRSILGWGGIAVINGIGARTGWVPDRAAALRRIEFASARLDELDSEHLFALLAKQNLSAVAGDWEGHVTVARMTIQRYPNHAPSYSAVGLGSVSLGQFDECVELIRRAIRLSPRDPLLGAWHLNLGICHFMRGEYAEAAAAERFAVQMSPTLPVPPLILAAALARDGKADEGRAVVAMHLQRYPGAKAADVPKLLRGDAPPFVAGRTRLMESLLELGMP
jgi:DNA-binding winged helix-turn-helix (wHTH) protein/TolB-like protein